MITPGAWGYRSSSERREWLADHALPSIDYCDVHNYPRDDHDSFIDSPAALKEFIENRAAAAFSLGKPLVMGEFGMSVDGHRDVSQVDWYKAFFDGSAAAGAGGAMFWILTPDPRRGYGVAYSTPRDEALMREVSRSSQVFSALQSADLPANLREPSRHLVPRQFAWNRSPGEAGMQPQMIVREDRSVLYQFKPQMAVAQRFEKIGGGPGYIWGYGSGFLEFLVPERSDRRRVSEIIVRAHIQPVLPIDAPAGFGKTNVTLFVEGWNAGSRIVAVASAPAEPTVHGMASHRLAPSPSGDAWSPTLRSLRRDPRLRLALRHKHLKLARRLRLPRRPPRRGRVTSLVGNVFLSCSVVHRNLEGGVYARNTD